jgi:hypothetical protein
VAGFGIKVTLVEPGGYATDWAGSPARHATLLPAYDGVREQAAQQRARRIPVPGDPAATRDAVLRLVDAPDPPLRLFLGEMPLGVATADYESRLATWRQWQPVAAAAQGGAAALRPCRPACRFTTFPHACLVIVRLPDRATRVWSYAG